MKLNSSSSEKNILPVALCPICQKAIPDFVLQLVSVMGYYTGKTFVVEEIVVISPCH